MIPFYSFWQQWFAQPLEEKMRRSRKLGLGGYYPPASESPGFTGKPDPKEYYHWRLKDAGKIGAGGTHQIFWKCHEQAEHWLLDRGLGVVVDAVQPDDCVLRIIHYPPTADGCVGEEHRDFDLLTVNVGGTAPGLEVKEDCGCQGEVQQHWASREGGIHVGEMLEIYTGLGGDQPPSIDMEFQYATSHRVRTAPNTERFAAVFFFLPPMDFVLRPGLTADDYLNAAPGSRADGWVGVLRRAGTYSEARR